MTLFQGYCRVIRIIRYLVKNGQGADQYDARSLSALLRDARLPSIKELGDMVGLFAKCGLHNTEKFRHSPDDKYHVILRQISHKLKLPEARKDPMTKLPREIIGLIASYFDTTTLIRCCRVSRSWRRVIELDKTLWSSIRLRRPGKSQYIPKFLQRHRDMRSLVLDDISRLDFSLPLLRTIVRLPKLQHLHIGSRPQGQLDPPISRNTRSLVPVELGHTARLTRLSLIFDGTAGGLRTWQSLLHSMSPDLEVLNLVPGVRLRRDFDLRFDGQPTPFPKLKKLRIGCEPHVYPELSLVSPFPYAMGPIYEESINTNQVLDFIG